MDQARIDKIKQTGNLPKHVAIIMDGNGRWAKKRGLPRTAGHKEGIESVRAVIEAAGALDINAVTLYTFSSENWSRPKKEVSALMSLLLKTVKREVNELNAKNVRLMTIGDLDALPTAPRLGIKNTIARLRKNDGLILNLALSYSGRQEIVAATKSIVNKVKNGEMSPEDITDETISGEMQTCPIGDPDLLIRTSGELRLSNFLLWQLAYTEIFITDVFWPDFRKEEFYKAIESFQARERRFGKVSEQVTQ